MNTKIKNRDILFLHEAINGLESTGCTLTFKIWYAMNRNKEFLFGELKTIYAQRDIIGKDYPKSNIELNNRKPEDPVISEEERKEIDRQKKDFEDKMNEYLDGERDMDIHKLRLDECASIPVKGFPLLNYIIKYLIIE